MAPDPDNHALAEQLFEAARRERPEAAVKRQALRAVPASKRSLLKQPWLLVALALGAAGLLLVLGQGFESGNAGPGPGAERSAIRAEPIPPPSTPVAPVSGPPKLVSQGKDVTTSPASASVTLLPAAPSSDVVARGVTPKAPPASLEEELEMLDAARQALLGGDTKTALMRLSQYDKAATRRQLGAEATVLRMQILAADGRNSEASALASQFVAKHPNSPLVDRAKSFVQRENIKEGVGP